ncbi:MAG: hypothetical protein FJ146_14405 [Deltaproteobacteria bacterium]|nr:hypothetical protein [Deltaproteobacteria bacterium]
MNQQTLIGLVSALSIAVTAACRTPRVSEPKSPMDPHYKSEGPWFEGWYTRVVDDRGQVDVAAIVGSFVRRGISFNDSAKEGYAALVVSDRAKGTSVTYEVFPEKTFLEAGGQPVTRNPDDKAPADFSWRADGVGHMTESEVDLRLAPSVRLRAQFGKPEPLFPARPWIGPEGAAAKLPFIWSHWFIYSTGSTTNYQLSTESRSWSGTGVSHMEKNYGSAFPASWVWLHAMTDGGANRLSVAGGPAPVPVIQPEVWSVSLKTKTLDWVFLPGVKDITVKRESAPCEGKFSITIDNPGRRLNVKAKAAPSGFVGIATASAEGWVKAFAHENYQATIEIDAYETNLLGGQKLMQHLSDNHGVLEFGGDHRCPTMKL